MSTHELNDRLRSCHRRGRLAALLAHLALAAGAWVALLLLVIAVDALLGTPTWGLIALNTLLAAAALAGVAWLIVVMVRWRYRPERVAVQLERRLGIADNQLINAVMFDASPGAAPGSERLRAEAITAGRATASQAPRDALIDYRRLRRGGGAFITALALLGLGALLLPGVYHAVFPRLLEPTANHPPFTLLTFDVRTAPEAIYYGRSGTVAVDIAGPRVPDRARVVFVDDDNNPLRPQPMHRRADTGEQVRSFELQMDRLERSRRFYIETAEGRSRLHDLTVLPVPLFEHVHVSYDYPSYTGWDASDEPLGPRGVRALRGTRVTLTVHSNIALAGGELTLLPADEADAQAQGTSVALEPDAGDPTVARASFEIDQPGRFALALESETGVPSDDRMAGRIRAVADEEPVVWIDEPQRQTIVPEGWSVDVELAARDDIGITRLELQRGVNDWGPVAVDLAFDPVDADGRTVRAAYQFDLGDLGARPGDVIEFFATAYDNYPAGPQSADSAVHTIHVISMDDYLDYARQNYRIENLEREWRAFQRELEALRAERDELLEELAELREQMDQGDLTPEQQQRMAELAQRLDEYADAAQELRERMRERAGQPMLYEFESAFHEMLADTQAGLGDQSQTAGALAQAMPSAGLPEDADALQDLMEAFAQQQAPFDEGRMQQWERGEHDLERLRMAEGLSAQAQRVLSLAERQRELATRLSAFRQREQLNPTEQLRAQRLATEQAALREELAQTVEQLRRQGEEAADDLPRMAGSALDLADAIDALRIEQDQSDAERLAQAGHGRYAHAAADLAAEKLESLIGVCRGMMGTPSQELDRPLGLSQSDLQAGLDDLAAARAASMGMTGADGYGMHGQSRLAVEGPALQRGGDADAAAAATRGDGQAATMTPGEADDPARADRVTAERTTDRGGGGGALPGVPAPYRDAAEAYFQRLADESE